MPVVARVLDPYRFSVFHDVREHVDFGVLRLYEFLQHVYFEWSEPATEPHVLFVRYLLIAQKHDRKLIERGFDFRKGLRIRILRKIDSKDLSAERRIERSDVHSCPPR